MRIAVYHNLPSGGAKRTLAELVRRLAPKHDIDVYTLSCSEHEFADLRPWAAAHRVLPFAPLRPMRSPFGRVNQVLRQIDLSRLDRLSAAIARQIDVGNYDVAFVHPCQFEQSPSVLQHLERTWSVYFCQEPRRTLYEEMPARPYDDEASGRRRLLNRLDPLPGLYRRRLRHVERCNTRAASSVLVNSRFMAETLEQIHGVRPHVTYLGVDAEQFSPPAEPRERFVLSVGSLTPLKGFDFLIASLAHYPQSSRPPLVIASNFQNPPEREYLQRRGRELGVQVELRGNVTENTLVALYRRAQVVAYAPVREPFGLVPLEAMACATPVVAVAEGGVSESIVHGETGLLVRRDPRQFSAALQAILDDAPLARRYGSNGREYVLAGWTWAHAVKTVEAHLRVRGHGASVPAPVAPALQG